MLKWIGFSLLGGLAIALPASAGILNDGLSAFGKSGTLEDEAGDLGFVDSDPLTITAVVIQTFLSILGLVAIIYVIYAGFLWMTARGNQDQAQKARDILRTATIGLVIILSSYSIALFVFNSIESIA